jgi:carboxypeptidase Q
VGASSTVREQSEFRLDPAAIEETLDEIDEIGVRYHGTPGEETCRDYVRDRFADLGLERLRIEAFRYLAYEPGSAAASVVSPETQELSCKAVQYSATEAAEGEAVYLGTGTREDFDRVDRLGIDLAGKVVVAHSIAPFVIAPFLADRGIAGFVNLADTPDEIVGNFTAALYRAPLEPPWEGRPVGFPAVNVEASAGRELLSTMSARPVTIAIEHRAGYVERESWNVVGELPGSSEGQVLVGAHYDTQLECPGIWDNGTGVASLFEIARVLRDRPLRRTAVIVGFGVEEVGLWGSTTYTVAHADELASIVGMVNLDAVASRYPAKRTIWTDEAMQEFAIEAAARQGWNVDVLFDARQFAFSDNTPFTEAGVPACWIWEFPPIHPYYHSSGDVRSLVEGGPVAATAGVSAQIALSLALDETIDLGRAGQTEAS